MPVLSTQQLRAIESQVLRYKQNPRLAPHGYPIALISDLLETAFVLKRRKKKYQHLLENLRGRCAKAIELLTPTEEENGND